MKNRVTKVKSCELNIDWTKVPTEYISDEWILTESNDTADTGLSGYDEYFGVDWEEQYGTLSCTGKSTEAGDCAVLNFNR